MKGTVFLVTALAILIFNCNCKTFAQPRTNNFSIKNLERDMQSSNWNVRSGVAEKLGRDHQLIAFQLLLKLLQDTNDDVSYAAAEAIELRGDQEFDEYLIGTIKDLPRDDRWFAYDACKNYTTKRMMDFLFGSLQEEIQFYKGKRLFDERNNFYICTSLKKIAQALTNNDQFNTLDVDDNKLPSYEKFAGEFSKLVSLARDH
jgi:hypothetical protein